MMWPTRRIRERGPLARPAPGGLEARAPSKYAMPFTDDRSLAVLMREARPS